MLPDWFLVMFFAETSLKSGPKSGSKVVLYHRIATLGPDLRLVFGKNITKNQSGSKQTQNPDFGLLEMLFCCGESNIVRFGCTWIGEKIVTKIVDTFSLI